MTETETDMVALLEHLLEQERSSPFRCVGTSGAYIDSPRVRMRTLIEQMSLRSQAGEFELGELIEQHGGTVPPAQVNMAFQHLAYMSMDFLLPRLVAAKRAMIAGYEAALVKTSDQAVAAVLRKHLEAHREDLGRLQGK